MDQTAKNSSGASGEKSKLPWLGSNQSDLDKKDDVFMTFQSKDPIIAIQLDRKASKERDALGESHGAHGLDIKHPTSYLETIMHLFKGNVGSGVFAMGDAIKNAGLLLGPSVVIVLVIVCVHCQNILLDASKKMLKIKNMNKAPDFAETVELCFANGPKVLQKFSVTMRRMVNTFLCITQLGFCCVYFLFLSNNVKQVMDYYGIVFDVHLHMAIALIPILLTSLVRNLKYIAPFSFLANVFICVGIVITVYFAVQDLPPLSDRNFVGTLSRFPLFFGTALFAFEGIGLVLPLQNEMRKPEQFQSPLGVLNVGMAIVTVCNLLVGVFGYLKYGEEVKGSVTLNLPEDSVLGQTVKIMIATGVLLGYALQFYIPVDLIWPTINASLGPFRFPAVAECTFRTALVLVTFILAEAIPYLSLFISLVGAVSSTALALLFPPLLEIVTKSSELNAWMVIKDSVIFVLGIIGMFTGTYESVKSIVQAFSATS